VKQGKVRAVGASNYSAKRLAQALEISERQRYPRYESLQPLYNLYDRSDFEGELQELCLKRNVGVIPYFSLASGFLAGKYRGEADLAGKPRSQFVQKYLNDRGFRILSVLDELAKQHGVTPAQVALAWLLTRPAVTAPIASATNLNQLKDLVAAATLQLDPASIDRLTQASA